MNYRIYPPTSPTAKSETMVSLPLSKSESNRALVVSALAGVTAPPYDVALCDDTEAMLRSVGQLSGTVNVGAAGTTMRFLTAFYASNPDADVIIDGSERMRQRPIGVLVDALLVLGADVKYVGENGFPPLKIKGKKLAGGVVTLDASVSSQFVSALMLIGPTMEQGLTLRLAGKPTSLPYILMTASMMMRAGIPLMMSDNRIIIPPSAYTPSNFAIEGDWSASSYWYEMVATGALRSVNIGPLRSNTIQGDHEVASIFENIGVCTSHPDPDRMLVNLRHVPTRLRTLNIDMKSCPDLAQTVAVTCCLRNVAFTITGLGTLPRKETDRLQALVSELRKLGYAVRAERRDTLVWKRERMYPEAGPVIETFDDHRMAMAFAPAAVRHPGIIIKDAGVVSKSYPNFWLDLQAAGFTLEEVEV